MVRPRREYVADYLSLSFSWLWFNMCCCRAWQLSNDSHNYMAKRLKTRKMYIYRCIIVPCINIQIFRLLSEVQLDIWWPGRGSCSATWGFPKQSYAIVLISRWGLNYKVILHFSQISSEHMYACILQHWINCAASLSMPGLKVSLSRRKHNVVLHIWLLGWVFLFLLKPKRM